MSGDGNQRPRASAQTRITSPSPAESPGVGSVTCCAHAGLRAGRPKRGRCAHRCTLQRTRRGRSGARGFTRVTAVARHLRRHQWCTNQTHRSTRVTACMSTLTTCQWLQGRRAAARTWMRSKPPPATSPAAAGDSPVSCAPACSAATLQPLSLCDDGNNDCLPRSQGKLHGCLGSEPDRRYELLRRSSLETMMPGCWSRPRWCAMHSTRAPEQEAGRASGDVRHRPNTRACDRRRRVRVGVLSARPHPQDKSPAGAATGPVRVRSVRRSLVGEPGRRSADCRGAVRIWHSAARLCWHAVTGDQVPTTTDRYLITSTHHVLERRIEDLAAPRVVLSRASSVFVRERSVAAAVEPRAGLATCSMDVGSSNPEAPR